MTTAERMLVVWCPDWPVVGLGQPGPVAVVEAGRVVACSAAARAEGVERGLRRRQAEARCPGLVVAARDPAGEARAFEPVVAAAESFTPRVEIVRAGVCAFATHGPSRYHGGDDALAAQVARAVGEHATCRVGVADGRFAAERAARHGRLVPVGESAAFLAPFPVTTLTASDPPDLADLLIRLGILALGDFAALPARAVLARFGHGGAAAHRLARGLDERPLSARAVPADLAVTAEIDPPAERVETVAFVARSLAARLHDFMVGQGLALDLVRIEAETEHGESLVRTWRLDHRSPVTAAALAERVRWQLEGWLTQADHGVQATQAGGPTGPLTLLRLVPEEVRADRGHQEGFWGGDRAAAEQAARALERVQGRLGPQAVATAVRAGGRHPAEQYRLVPWGDPQPKALAVPPWPGHLPAPAPATVAAAHAEVVDAAGAPVGVNGRGLPTAPPAQVSVAGAVPSRVVEWAGPWPTDERWWDAHAHRRRALWQVITAAGDAHLLSLEGGRWTVEATYD